MVLLGITALFPSWFDNRDIIYKEVTRRFISHEKVLAMEKAEWKENNDQFIAVSIEQSNRQRSQRLGIAYEDYKKEIDDFNLLNEQLMNAIKRNDIALIDKISQQFRPEQLNSNYLINVIQNENVDAFSVLYENSSACNVKESLAVKETVKDKVISHFFDPSSTERTVYYRILQGSNDDLLRAWFKADCLYDVAQYVDNKSKFEFLNELFKALVKKGTSNRVLSLEGLNDYNYLVHLAIHQNLINKKEKVAQTIFQEAYSDLTKNQKALSLNFLLAENSNRDSSDIFLHALRRGQLLFAKTVLEYDKEYIKRNNLTANIYKTIIAKKFPDRETVELLTHGYLNFHNSGVDMSGALVFAVENGTFRTVNLLLHNDSELTFNELPVTNWRKFDRAIRDKSLNEFKLLLDRGLDFNKFDFKGLDQLARAMNEGNVELVDFLLLNAKIDPVIEYRGKTILDMKIGGDVDTQASILAQLKKHGAHDDYFKIVRERTGVAEDPNCSVGEQLGLESYADNRVLFVITNSSIRKIGLQNHAELMDYCDASLTYCTSEKGQSIDDCVTSIPVCPDNVTIDPNTIKPAEICCPNEIRNIYVAARCSGLDAYSSTFYLSGQGLHETYSIPTFLTGTKEYQEFHKAKNQITVPLKNENNN